MPRGHRQRPHSTPGASTTYLCIWLPGSTTTAASPRPNLCYPTILSTPPPASTMDPRRTRAPRLPLLGYDEDEDQQRQQQPCCCCVDTMKASRRWAHRHFNMTMRAATATAVSMPAGITSTTTTLRRRRLPTATTPSYQPPLRPTTFPPGTPYYLRFRRSNERNLYLVLSDANANDTQSLPLDVPQGWLLPKTQRACPANRPYMSDDVDESGEPACPPHDAAVASTTPRHRRGNDNDCTTPQVHWRRPNPAPIPAAVASAPVAVQIVIPAPAPAAPLNILPQLQPQQPQPHFVAPEPAAAAAPPPESQQEDPPADPTSHAVAQILEVIPDVEPKYLLGLVQMNLPMFAGQTAEHVLGLLFEDGGYPRVAKKRKVAVVVATAGES
ncbi:hypothetical protein BDZ97DRAFT_1912930 [Flammula alnicola]|nr:hypothetical protein BDZ97DRAFT_1912930 [Flammula alnicola]